MSDNNEVEKKAQEAAEAAAEAEKASYRSTMKNSQAAGHIVSLKVAEIEKDYSEAYRALVKMEPKAKVAKAVTYTPRTK